MCVLHFSIIIKFSVACRLHRSIHWPEYAIEILWLSWIWNSAILHSSKKSNRNDFTVNMIIDTMCSRCKWIWETSQRNWSRLRRLTLKRFYDITMRLTRWKSKSNVSLFFVTLARKYSVQFIGHHTTLFTHDHRSYLVCRYICKYS